MAEQWRLKDSEAEFWVTVSAHVAFYGQGMGLAQPAVRDISLDGEIVEFHRDQKQVESWVSSHAIRRVRAELLARELVRQANCALTGAAR